MDLSLLFASDAIRQAPTVWEKKSLMLSAACQQAEGLTDNSAVSPRASLDPYSWAFMCVCVCVRVSVCVSGKKKKRYTIQLRATSFINCMQVSYGLWVISCTQKYMFAPVSTCIGDYLPSGCTSLFFLATVCRECSRSAPPTPRWCSDKTLPLVHVCDAAVTLTPGVAFITNKPKQKMLIYYLFIYFDFVT